MLERRGRGIAVAMLRTRCHRSAVAPTPEVVAVTMPISFSHSLTLRISIYTHMCVFYYKLKHDVSQIAYHKLQIVIEILNAKMASNVPDDDDKTWQIKNIVYIS
ncbi:hypothetical protein Hanom_Chr01g00064391 [Helianthus anomalus]